MADALTRFGLSRRPASEMFGEAPRPRRDSPTDLFGAADMRGPGWSDSARRAVEEHQAAIDEKLAIEDERIAREREREAEAVADEFTRIQEPSAREKFFDENEAAMTGSRRYHALAEMRQRQPSFADNVLAKNLANKIDDPDERNEFLAAVARGEGTFAAKDRSDRFRMRRGADAQLAKLGMHPQERKRILDEEGYDDAVVNYYAAQKEGESSFSKDPQARAAESYYRILKDKARYEENKNGSVSDETEAEMLRVSSLLGSKYKMIAEPPAPAAAAPVGTGTVLRPKAGAAAPTTPATEKVAEEGTVGGGMPKTSDDGTVGGGMPKTSDDGTVGGGMPKTSDDGTKGLRSIISNPDVPEVDRNVAFTELKTLLESQTPPKGSTFTEIAKFKNDLKERIDSARVDLEANRFRGMVAPVWTREKDIVAKAIKRMAQDLGAEEDTVIASLFPKDKNGKPAEQQRIPMSIVPKEMQPRKRDKFGEREMYVKDLLAAYLADQRGEDPADANYERTSKAKIEDLSGWMKSADEGDYPDKEVYKKAIRKVGLDADRTQEDVIREYINGVTLPAQEVAPVKAPSGREIKIGKPEKTP